MPSLNRLRSMGNKDVTVTLVDEAQGQGQERADRRVEGDFFFEKGPLA